MVQPVNTFTNLYNFIKFLDNPVGYLEKNTVSDLGDWTENGKVRNAGYNNYTVYWDWYKDFGLGNYQGQAYCAGAVSMVFVCGFGYDKAKKLLNGFYIYCPTGYNQFKNKGRIYSSPKVGDVVFFWSSSLNRWGHTGIVIGVDSNGNGYTTWEANTTSGNDILVRNGGATCKKHYTIGSRKVAFGRPDYEGNGISLEEATPDVTYSIGTGPVNPLKVTATSLNVRSSIGTSSTVVGSLKYGDIVVPDKKGFLNGDPWFHVPAKDGWISAKYLTGWVQEHDFDDKWWYLLPGYTWYTDTIAYIDGNHYFFDASGYMFTGEIILKTDENGVLKIGDKSELE